MNHPFPAQVAIGAPHNAASGKYGGHVRIYEWGDGAWAQRGEDVDSESAWDRAGVAVDLNGAGDVVAVGAKENNPQYKTNAGHVRVHQWLSGQWRQLGDDIDGEAYWDFSGCAVALSDDGYTVAIGAERNGAWDGTKSIVRAGHVRVHVWSDGAWKQRGADIDGKATMDRSGLSVSINAEGTVVALGAPGKFGAEENDDHGSSDDDWGVPLDERTGFARVYEWGDGAWTQRGGDIAGEAAYDYAGDYQAVKLSATGDVVAVGASLNDGNGKDAGHVRVFEWAGGAWEQMGQDIDGEIEYENFGRSIALSADARTLAVGAVAGPSSTDPGVGAGPGTTRLYVWDGAAWRKRIEDIVGEDEEDMSGHVALSGDGKVLAVGAGFNDASNDDAWGQDNRGHTRVFTFGSEAGAFVGEADGFAAGDQGKSKKKKKKKGAKKKKKKKKKKNQNQNQNKNKK